MFPTATSDLRLLRFHPQLPWLIAKEVGDLVNAIAPQLLSSHHRTAQISDFFVSIPNLNGLHKKSEI